MYFKKTLILISLVLINTNFTLAKELSFNNEGAPDLSAYGVDDADQIDTDDMSCTPEGCSICMVAQYHDDAEEQYELNTQASSKDTSIGEEEHLGGEVSDIFGDNVENHIDFCSDSGDRFKKDKVADRKKAKEMQKKCRAEFKKAKKRSIQAALKNKRFIAALKLRLKSFKRNSKSKDFKTKTIQLGQYEIDITNGEDREKLEQEILNSLLENKRYKKIFEKQQRNEAKNSQRDNNNLLHPQYGYSFEGYMGGAEIVDISTRAKCRLKLEVPELLKPKIQVPRVMKPISFLANYPNDCAFLISKSFSESDAAKVMGLDPNAADYKEQRLKYCSKTQDQVKSSREKIISKGGADPIDNLNQRVSQLIEAAQEGLVPNFTINSTRNLYDDNTAQLAQKRGHFVQNYLWTKLDQHYKNTAQNRPKWLYSKEIFKQHIKVETPEYDSKRNNGDFGPSPYAKPNASTRIAKIGGEKKQVNVPSQQQEVNKLVEYYTLQDQELKEKKKSLNQEITNKTEQRKKLESTLVMTKKTIDKLKKELKDIDRSSNSKKFNTAKEKFKELSHLILKYQTNVQKITLLNNQIPTLKNDIDATNSKIEKVEGILSNDVQTLRDFYADSNKKQDKYKDLFHKFKKVEFDGGFKGPESDTDILEQFASPKLKALLAADANYADYSCSFKAGVLKKFEIKTKDPREHKLRQWRKKRKKRSRIRNCENFPSNSRLRRWINTRLSNNHNRIEKRRGKRASRINKRRRERYNNKKEKYGEGETFETLQLIGIEDPASFIK